MSKDPAVLFYYTDFLNGTKRMTFDQKGLYIELLCEQCDSKTGSISEEDFTFIIDPYRATYGDSYATKVLSKFGKDDSGYFNSIMREHINKRKNYTDSRKKNLKGTNNKAHMEPHMGTHMEDENENENENENKNKNIIKDKYAYEIITAINNVINIKEVREYFEFQGSGEFADDFYNHFHAQDWLTGTGRVITNWQCKANVWIKKELRKEKEKNNGRPAKGAITADNIETLKYAAELKTGVHTKRIG